MSLDYVVGLVVSILLMGYLAYAIQRLQHLLQLNPQKLPAVGPELAFNTAASFTTNTNCQSYGGESTMSYQGRDAHLDHVEAEQEVLAEAAGGDVGLEVPVGGRDDAHVRVARAALADALEALVLQEAQELGLQGRRDLADLVEEQRAALGGLDPAGLVADRAVNAPAACPKSSLASSSSDSVGQLTVTNGRA